MRDDADFAWLNDAMPKEGSTSRYWTLIDLRRFRSEPSRDLPATWGGGIIDGFDMALVAPEITPSTLLGAR